MPGSNDYSMDPTLLLGNEPSKAAPTLVSKASSNPGSAPEGYKMKDFDMNAWVASVLKERYGTDGSNRDFRRLNRYLSSKDGIAALQEAKDKHRKTEEFKRWSALQQQQIQAKDEKEKEKTLQTISKSTTKPVSAVSKQPIKPAWTVSKADSNKMTDTYTVESGNTLGQIVSTYNKKNNANLKVADVAKWSGIANADKIKIGNVIRFTDPTASQATPTDVQSNTTATSAVETTTPAANNEKADSSMVQSMPSSDSLRVDSAARNSELILPVDTGNVAKVDSALLSSPDSLRLDSASKDSSLVLPVDTGNVVRADSALLSSPDSASIAARTPVSTIRSPRNFTRTGQYFNYPTEQFMQEMNYWRNYFNSKNFSQNNVSSNKQGGTMNRINYFQQGGAAPSAQYGQADAFMQAVLQGNPEAIQQLIQLSNNGDEQATQIIQTILDANKKGIPDVAKAAQVIQQILGVTSAKWGSKLQYIRSLKYAKGGKTCPTCQAMEKGAEVEMKKCGGKKMKKRYFGGYL